MGGGGKGKKNKHSRIGQKEASDSTGKKGFTRDGQKEPAAAAAAAAGDLRRKPCGDLHLNGLVSA